MKIRTKLLISALVPLTFLALSTVVQVRVEREVDRYQHRGLLLGEIARGFAALDILMLEQRQLSRERAHVQWLDKYHQLEVKLDTLRKELTDEEQRPAMERVLRSFVLLGNLDTEYNGTSKVQEQTGGRSSEIRSYANRIESRMRQELHLIIPEIERLYDTNDVKITQVDQRKDHFVILMLALLAIVSPVFAWLLHRTVTAPMRRLQEGIELISAGNLDVRLPVDSDDEIGTVSRLFNVMTEKRQQGEAIILQMNEELEQRVAERTRELEDVSDELKISEEKYRIVAENTLAWEFWLDPHGQFVYTSPSCQQLTGFSADTFYADPEQFIKIVHPDDKELFIQHRHEVQRGDGEAEYLVFRIMRPDGTVVWLEHVCQPIFGKDGSFMGNRGCNRDITERIYGEHELQESRQLLANIIDFLPDATFVIDNDKKVIAWNRAIEEMTGVSKEQMLGQGDHAYTVPFYGVRRNQLLDLLDIDDEELSSRYRHVLRKGEALFAEIEAPHLYNGKGACLWVAGAPLYSVDNKRIGAVEIIRDISDKKKIELDLLQAKHAAETSNRSKSEFLANMSHEIRTPMNAIIGMAYLALQTELSTRQYDYVTKIQQAAESLLGIINDILDFSKIEAGKLELEAIPFELGDLFDQLATIIVSRAEEKGLEIMFSSPVGFRQILVGDPLRLGQVLGNLAGNAVKFTEQGHVIIGVEQSGVVENGSVSLTFSVRDTGIGMAHEVLASVFEAFSQADSSITRKYGGTGLGLSIVTRLLELMDTTLEVESEPGHGSSFSFTVRLAVAEEQQQKQPEMPEDLRGLRVLVVDDNAAAREILCSMMTSFRFAVTAVDSGRAALAEINNGMVAGDPYSLVLMDWMMPEIDGFETIRRIREDETIIQPPAIIMVTAFGGDELRRQVLQLQKTAFLTKPVQPSTLLNTALELFGCGERHPVRHRRIGVSHVEGLKQIRGARILIVEDNSINQQVAREILEQAGMVVTVAESGLAAVTTIDAGEQFDAVLMDIQMPDMDGYEACNIIRQHWSTEELPIIAMTAHALPEDREKCLASGMNDFVAKPITPSDMYAALITWIPPKKVSVPATGSAPGIVVETELGGTLLPLLPGLDVAAGLMRVGGNRRLYCHIITDFKEQNRSVLDNIRAAHGRGEYGKVRTLVHTLKGISSTIGAMSLAATLSEYEQITTHEVNDTCSGLFDILETQLTEVFTAVASVAATCPECEMGVTISTLPQEELESWMQALYGSLLDNSLGARKLIEQLHGHIGSLEWQEIQKLITRLDFEKAALVLERTGKTFGFDLQGGK
jgi:PAS domain S-box-containing protein